jgi:hypothetical protein
VPAAKLKSILGLGEGGLKCVAILLVLFSNLWRETMLDDLTDYITRLQVSIMRRQVLRGALASPLLVSDNERCLRRDQQALEAARQRAS